MGCAFVTEIDRNYVIFQRGPIPFDRLSSTLHIPEMQHCSLVKERRQKHQKSAEGTEPHILYYTISLNHSEAYHQNKQSF